MPTVLTGSYSATADITLKALYSHTETSAAGYELVTEAPADWTGDYVITSGTGSDMYVLKGVSGTKKLESASAGATAAFSATGIALEGNSLTGVANDYVFHVAMNGSNYTIRNAATGAYLASRGNYLYSYKTYAANYCQWSLAVEDGVVQVSNGASRTFPYLGFNAAKGYFSLAKTAGGVYLWKMGGTSSTTTYTTQIG